MFKKQKYKLGIPFADFIMKNSFAAQGCFPSGKL